VLLPPDRGVEGAVVVPPPALPELLELLDPLELPELLGRLVSFGSDFGSGFGSGSGLVVVVVVVVGLSFVVVLVEVLPVDVLPVVPPDVLPVEPVRLPGLNVIVRVREAEPLPFTAFTTMVFVPFTRFAVNTSDPFAGVKRKPDSCALFTRIVISLLAFTPVSCIITW
jgi:hypothetical protein